VFPIIFLKELRENVISRRFAIVLLVCLILIPLGLHVSWQDYQKRRTDYQESLRIYDQDHQKISDVLFKEGGKAFRPPSGLSFLALGLELFLPTRAETGKQPFSNHVDLRFNNDQGQDFLYDYIHGPLDLVFIVSVVLSFFAIVLTYGAIALEREQGTLAQILSNAVPRHQVLLAKTAAHFLTLILPFLISLGAGILLLQAEGLPVWGAESTGSSLLIALLFSVLFIGAFFHLGLLISCMTRRAVSAIVTLLLCWVGLFGLLPRLSVFASQIICPVASRQRVNLEKDQIRYNNRLACESAVDRLLDANPDAKIRASAKARKEFNDTQQAIRDRYRLELAQALEKIERNYQAQRQRQIQVAEVLSRVSPFTCFIRPMTEIAGTGITEYRNFQDQTGRYENALNGEIYNKQTRNRRKGGIASSFKGDYDASPPRFQHIRASFSKIWGNLVPDLLILILYNFLFFSGTFVAFLRYDPRR
jgi:ABC-type transport system involved in multi-copper enzyme maturation permease subunit